MNKRRAHPKMLQFPPELVDAVNQLIVKGHTYQDVTDFITERGHEISIGSVKRYGKNFLARLERIKVVKEQAKAIVDANPDSPSTEMAEAANQLATQLIMEYLMQLPDLEGAKATEVLKALSQLERSAVAREKLKYEFNRGVEAALTKIKEALRQELTANPSLMNQVLTLVDKTKEQIAI